MLQKENCKLVIYQQAKQHQRRRCHYLAGTRQNRKTELLKNRNRGFVKGWSATAAAAVSSAGGSSSGGGGGGN